MPLCNNQKQSRKLTRMISTTNFRTYLGQVNHLLLWLTIVVAMPLKSLIGYFCPNIYNLCSSLFQLLDWFVPLELVYHCLHDVSALLIQALWFQKLIQELYFRFVSGDWVLTIVVTSEKILSVLVGQSVLDLRLLLFPEKCVACHR